MNGILQARVVAMKTPKAQSAQTAPAIPANIKACVPDLTPLTRTKTTTENSAQGAVEALVIVGPKGNVEDAEPLSGPEAPREGAVDTVKRWTFRPVIREGEPANALTTASVYFSSPRSRTWQKLSKGRRTGTGHAAVATKGVGGS